mgnify:CR=1 FL=1
MVQSRQIGKRIRRDPQPKKTMNETQKQILIEAAVRLLWYSSQLESMDAKLNQVASDIAESGHFAFDEGSIFDDDVSNLSRFQMEFDQLARTATALSKTFDQYALEGFEDYAKTD